MKPHRLIAPLLAWAALTSCAQTPPAPTAALAPPAAPAASEPESARLGRELRALIGTPSCSSDSQCRTIAVGAKACGGPVAYWAWSTQATDAQKLTALAAQQAAVQRREVEASGMRSNCAMAVDPGAVCVAQRCELATPQSAR
ncbi:hypothetical protein J2X20_005596 [Pelomonas saccharophila]|uniref:DUF4189 domain-containing protein n=1 Tax=Roseateles saccharophilus TaxID=304 RepID=A0ABU1YVL2_ROSSA|nr:hypothetical protein [Roseateles saccharophilus]MDR7272911.1 hypothetical protein [Roseateles saccharophilus]